MQKLIQKYVLENWERLAPSRPRPASLATLQISQSHTKDYRFGRIIHLLFEEGSSKPVIAARFCRDRLYENSLAVEAELLGRLVETGMAQRVPRFLDFPVIGERKVLLEEAVPGTPISTTAQNQYRVLGPDAFREVVSSHFQDASVFLKSLGICGVRGGRRVPGETVWAEMEPVLAKYSDGYGLDKAEKDFVFTLAGAARDLTGENAPSRLAHNDFVPSNLFLNDDGGIKVIDWEFAGMGRLGFLDVMRFINHYFNHLDSMGVFGGNGFHDTFIGRSNWFYSMSLDFAREVEGGLIRDAGDFQTLFSFFLLSEAALQMTVTMEWAPQDFEFFRGRFNSLAGFDPFAEKNRLQSETEAYRAELANVRSYAEHLSRVVNSMSSSKSWRITSPLRYLSRMLKRKP